jgi:antitoxin component YwqK of YwqJK toxin-antitoxin module
MLRLFDEKKQIAVFDKYHPDFIRLYDTGIPRSIKRYSDGEKRYVCRYYASGSIDSISHWKYGRLHGRYLHWDINGNNDVHVMYYNGKIIHRFI